MQKIPIILDTDIGDDIDDTWALAMLLNSPELEVKLITTAVGNTTYRAKLVARLLEIAGRTDVPVGVGIHEDDAVGSQGPWVADYDLSTYPGTIKADGVDALIRTIMASPEPVTLISIGPLPNIAEALRREPRIAEHVNFVGMHGSVRKGYNGKATIDAEYNVKQDVAAAQAVFTARWEMTITPVDTCGLVKLSGAKFRAVTESAAPLAQAVIENYRIWAGGTLPAASSTLFDTVAVYLAYSSELLEMEPLGIRISDDGFTLIDPSAKVVNCAMDWKDLPAFEDIVVARICRI